MTWSRRRKWVVVLLLVAILAIPAWYLASPLFIVVRGTEAPPADFTTVVGTGSFVEGEPGHHASGTARLLTDGTRFLLRVEDFSVTNGPDIHVYLAKGARVVDGDVDLGSVKVTEGSANYAIPDGVDPQEYAYVVIWCVPFRVQFGYAELTFT